jgi:TonB family protein
MGRVSRLTGPGALVASALLHAVLVAGGAWLLHRSLSLEAAGAQPAPASTVEVAVTPAAGVELPTMSREGLRGASDPTAEPEPQPAWAFGGERTARPEIADPGRGGSDETREAALNLADSNDGLTLERDPMNRLDRSQVQRLWTGELRESVDDRRATPNPTELSFLASGRGALALRRPPADTNPSRGIRNGANAENAGSVLGGPQVDPGNGHDADPGGNRAGSDRDQAALGVAVGGKGRDYRRSAAVMLARPMVPRSRAAVPAPVKGRANDNADSTQDVASAVASLIHASTAGGRSGAGPGGSAGGGPIASGGLRGTGSRSGPAGTGPGAFMDVGADSGVVGYFRGIEHKVEPYWREAFPDWAIAEGRSGIAVVALVIRRDGTLASAALARSSGVPEFDQNVLHAVLRAAPFGPLPRKLLPGPQPLRIAFDATNPAVGRDGPGRGQHRSP